MIINQRIGPVAKLPALLQELGLDVAAAFAGSGIEPEALHPDARFAYSAIMTLLERAAFIARQPALGLLLGARCDHRDLGLIGDMMASAPTLGDAFRDYVEMQIGYSRSAVVYLQADDENNIIGYGLHDNDVMPNRQVHDLVMAMGCNMVRSLTGGRVRPQRALLSVSSPDDLTLYRTLLGTAASFDQEQTAVLVTFKDMALRLPGANAARRAELRATLLQLARGGLEDIAAQVRRALRPRLMLDENDRDAIAQVLGIGPRTLTRRLSAAGTTFEAIKDEMRFTVARELLALTRLPIGRVAETLAYADNSAFNHAFTRWASMSPSQWRNRQRDADVAVAATDNTAGKS